jgi:hypothetical protein
MPILTNYYCSKASVSEQYIFIHRTANYILQNFKTNVSTTEWTGIFDWSKDM